MIQLSYWPIFCKQAPVEASPPLPSFSPPPPPAYSRPRAPLFSVFTLRSFGGASIILHSSSFLIFLFSTGLHHQCFNVTSRKTLNKMELSNKLRWDQFLILAAALMSPALTWVHLRAPRELVLHAGCGYMEFGKRWGKSLCVTVWFKRTFNIFS